jgi:hypothetical protein
MALIDPSNKRIADVLGITEKEYTDVIEWLRHCAVGDFEGEIEITDVDVHPRIKLIE